MANTTLTIRPSVRNDLAAIDRLFAESYPALLKRDYAPSLMVTAVPMLARAQPRLVGLGTYFVAVEGDTLVAAGGWSWTSPQGSVGSMNMGHVRHVVTDHRCARRGIGTRLMRHAMALAWRAGICRLECQSTLTAVPFYASLGFEMIGRVEIRLAPGILFPAVEMRRRLSAADLYTVSGNA